MKSRTTLINYLAHLNNAKSYLEIGVFDRNKNFNKIKIGKKTCVDPDPNAKADFIQTSDAFFAANRETFDVIFIDGLHEAEQVKRDFDNALNCLNENGFIVMHDCNPQNKQMTELPGYENQWCGDVYLFAVTLSEYSGIDFRTVDMDYGCTVVWKDKGKTGKPLLYSINWEVFDKNRKQLLRLVEPIELMRVIEKVNFIQRNFRFFKRKVKHLLLSISAK